jgi:hypothetical protein
VLCGPVCIRVYSSSGPCVLVDIVLCACCAVWTRNLYALCSSLVAAVVDATFSAPVAYPAHEVAGLLSFLPDCTVFCVLFWCVLCCADTLFVFIPLFQSLL